MRFFRSQRVASVIREQLALILIREVEIPGVLVTITDVDVTKKLDYAGVKVSFLPSEQTPKAFKMLMAQTGRLQHLLNRTLNIKPMPRIAFVIDRGPENLAKVEKLLSEGDQP